METRYFYEELDSEHVIYRRVQKLETCTIIDYLMLYDNEIFLSWNREIGLCDFLEIFKYGGKEIDEQTFNRMILEFIC